jgi:hypothetical protein
MSRTFLPLSNRLAGKASTGLLGRIIAYPKFPFASSTRDARELLSNTEVDLNLEKDAETFISQGYDAKLKGALEGLLSFETSRKKNESFNVTSTRIHTYMLRDHLPAFHIVKHDPEVKAKLFDPHVGVFREGGGHAWFITGFQTCWDGKFTDSLTKEFEFATSATIPLSKCASMLGPWGYMFSSVDPKIDTHRWKQIRCTSTAQGEGEQVFAIQCRRVEKTILGQVTMPRWEEGFAPDKKLQLPKEGEEGPKEGEEDCELVEDPESWFPEDESKRIYGIADIKLGARTHP